MVKEGVQKMVLEMSLGASLQFRQIKGRLHYGGASDLNSSRNMVWRKEFLSWILGH